MLMTRQALGRTGLRVPPIVFGSSCLGNLYEELPWATKLAIMSEWFRQVAPPVVIDTAGKYGAGLALEVMGRGFRELGIAPDQILLSNKLGWRRVPLRTPEPTFEPGAWKNLAHDAEQDIGYAGIRRCWEQGCELLGGDYRAALVSVHDPDEYLAAATSAVDRGRRVEDILEAYRALFELQARGEATAVGIGAKDWRVIREISAHLDLDWVMFANSLTVYSHPPELLEFMASLAARGVGIVNSAVFHGGFLTGSDYFDYRKIDPAQAADRERIAWRESFNGLCREHGVNPAEACVRFGMSGPGVIAISLNSSKPERVRKNVAAVQAKIPAAFWQALKDAGLLARDYPYGTAGSAELRDGSR